MNHSTHWYQQSQPPQCARCWRRSRPRKALHCAPLSSRSPSYAFVWENFEYHDVFCTYLLTRTIKPMIAKERVKVTIPVMITATTTDPWASCLFSKIKTMLKVHEELFCQMRVLSNRQCQKINVLCIVGIPESMERGVVWMGKTLFFSSLILIPGSLSNGL